jgi:hypothetical protein
MNDQTKLSLFDALLAYLFQSSAAMDDTARALAPDPLHAARVAVLNDALDSARVLLSKVIIPCFNPFMNRFPHLFIVMARLERILLLDLRKRR